MLEPSFKHRVRRISCQKFGEETHVATKGNPKCARQNTVVSCGPEESVWQGGQRQEAISHNDNPTVSVRDGSARKGTLESCSSVKGRITEHSLMWKGGLNEGLKKEGRI
jgi:hypothetical protein